MFQQQVCIQNMSQRALNYKEKSFPLPFELFVFHVFLTEFSWCSYHLFVSIVSCVAVDGKMSMFIQKPIDGRIEESCQNKSC